MKRRHREHVEDMQSLWEDVAPELEARWRSSHQHGWHRHSPFWEEEWESRRSRTSAAYATAKAIEAGMEPRALTDEALTWTVDASIALARDANHLVGSTEEQGNSELATRLRADGRRIALSLRADDLPEEEVAVLRAMGVGTTEAELHDFFRRVRARARVPRDERYTHADVHEGDVFRRAVGELESALPGRTAPGSDSEEKAKPRPARQFFSGVRKVIFGSALVVGDVGLAFGFPSPLFPSPDHGWATLGSIVGGVDIGIDGVGDLVRGRRPR